MFTVIKASQSQNSEKKSKKSRKKTTLQALQAKTKPTAWLRSLISPIDFGVKIKTLGKLMEPISKPIHCNTNAEILDAFRFGDWHRIERLSNPMLDDHWNNRATYYFVGDGSGSNRYILVNLDIDCHTKGSKRGATEVAEYLKANFFPDLYHEPSTNGRGRHGYFILDKWDLGAEAVKRLLKNLERYLNAHLLAQGFDIEMCEIKGLPPVVTWGEDDRLSNYTAGILAKIPRQVHRFEEWKRTTVLDQFRLRRLVTTLRTLTPQIEGVETAAPKKPEPSTPKIAGSIGGKLIDNEELAQLTEAGHYRHVASTLLKTHTLKTSGRSVVMIEDVAIFLLCLKFFTSRMNTDGTLPVRRFDGLWTGLYEAGDVGRAFDCHRFKVIRDYLSDLGLIDWEDHTFVVPRIDESGQMRKGRACKWKGGQKLMDMLDWEKCDVLEEKAGRGVEDTKTMIHEGEDERASFVGTVPKVKNTGDDEEGRGEAPFVGTTSPLKLLSLDPIQLIVQSLHFVPDELKIRPVEQAECKAWHLFPDEVTSLIPSFDESLSLLAA